MHNYPNLLYIYSVLLNIYAFLSVFNKIAGVAYHIKTSWRYPSTHVNPRWVESHRPIN